MEPDLYEIENDQREDYSQDEWYYQNEERNREEDEEWDDFDNMEDDYENDSPNWYF